VIPLAALIPAACIVHWSLRRRKAARPLVALAAVSLACLGGPIAWFWCKSGRPALTTSTGLHLHNRVVNEQKLLDRNAPAARKLLAAVRGADPAAFAWWDLCEFPGLRDWDPLEQERLLRQVAVEGIRLDPLGYLRYTPWLAWRMFVAPTDWIAPWAETNDVSSEMESPPILALTSSSLDWRLTWEEMHRLAWPVLCWAAIVGATFGMMSRHRALVLALAWIPAGYLLGSASVEHFAPRYNAAVAPFIALLATLPLEYVRNLLQLRTRAAEPAEPLVMAGAVGDAK
jgi:hypothetical protein